VAGDEIVHVEAHRPRPAVAVIAFEIEGALVCEELSHRVDDKTLGVARFSGEGVDNDTVALEAFVVSHPDAAVEPFLQENVLFNRSIRDNIALADPGLPMDRVIAAAELAGAHEFILELPQGYDTMMGERGASLSGGQRQRIAIARALITDPRILIFDEATSALDYESERIIQDNMRRIAQGRTVLIIAHRLSTIRRADRIVTIERGRVVEDGVHDELIRLGGRYASLHRLQAGLHEAG
jgi:ABC-type bacteriocin/lantibiotic exporter with double-glycine peptidase domain